MIPTREQIQKRVREEFRKGCHSLEWHWKHTDEFVAEIENIRFVISNISRKIRVMIDFKVTLTLDFESVKEAKQTCQTRYLNYVVEKIEEEINQKEFYKEELEFMRNYME